MSRINPAEIDALRKAVCAVVSTIPRGRATSYGAIARAIGYPDHSRMIGRMMGMLECDNAVPAHRVVNSQGVLSGSRAFGAPGRMRELLEKEGIRVSGNRIVGWRNVFWDPLREIGL